MHIFAWNSIIASSQLACLFHSYNTSTIMRNFTFKGLILNLGILHNTAALYICLKCCNLYVICLNILEYLYACIMLT